MYCVNCGNPVNDEALFCTNCGFRVKNNTEVPVVARKKNLSWKLWTGIAVLAILSGVLLYFFVFASENLENTKWVQDGNYTLAFTDERNGYLTIGESRSFMNCTNFTYTVDGDWLTMTPESGSVIRVYFEIDDGMLILTKPGDSEKDIWFSAEEKFACDSCGEVFEKPHYGLWEELCMRCAVNE